MLFELGRECGRRTRLGESGVGTLVGCLLSAVAIWQRWTIEPLWGIKSLNAPVRKSDDIWPLLPMLFEWYSRKGRDGESFVGEGEGRDKKGYPISAHCHVISQGTLKGKNDGSTILDARSGHAIELLRGVIGRRDNKRRRYLFRLRGTRHL